MSSASPILDPVEAARDDVDRSRRLIAKTLDDLTLHHSWLETYHREERRRAERLRRQEALERLELRRQRAAFRLRRFAVRTYFYARAGTAYLAASGVAVLTAAGTFLRRAGALLRWAAPRAYRFARRTIAALAGAFASCASSIWDGVRLLSAGSSAASQMGFLWSVRASEEAGIVFRQKARRFALLPAARLGRKATRKAASITAPARKRAGRFWMRISIKTQARAVKLARRLAAARTGTSIHADGTAPARRSARGLTRMGVKTQARLSRRATQFKARLSRRATQFKARLSRRAAQFKAAAIESSRKAARSRLARHSAAGAARTRVMARSLLRRLKAQAVGATGAIKATWQKQAQAASVHLARTRRSAAVLEKRAAEHVIRSGPRIGRFLAQHGPARKPLKSRALIVRPNTALVHADDRFAPAPRSV